MPLPQSVTASVHFSSADSGIARAELGRQPREPRAERERLHAGARPDGGVEEQHERARVGVHRAGDVAEDDELARHLLAGAVRAVDGVAAGAERLADELAHVEAVAARVGAAAARGAQRPLLGDRRDQPLDAAVLVGRHLGEVLVAQELVAGRAELERVARLVVRLAAGRVRERFADLLLRQRALGGAHRRQHGRPQEPGVERAVEEVELVVARDERLPQREVDVLLAGQVDGGDAAQRVGDATRARPRARPRAGRGRR